MLMKEITIGLIMMVLTIVIHSLFMVWAVKLLRWRQTRFGDVKNEILRAALLSVTTVWLFLAIVIEAWLWALLYLIAPLIKALPDMKSAFYFSMVTFTTLGYGDITFTDHGRTLASIQAANGVIIFGWTTALIMYFIQHIFKKP
jgi:hypothetical protein